MRAAGPAAALVAGRGARPAAARVAGGIVPGAHDGGAVSLDLGGVGDRVRGECETRSGIEAFEGALVRSFDLVRHGLYPPADRITYI